MTDFLYLLLFVCGSYTLFRLIKGVGYLYNFDDKEQNERYEAYKGTARADRFFAKRIAENIQNGKYHTIPKLVDRDGVKHAVRHTIYPDTATPLYCIVTEVQEPGFDWQDVDSAAFVEIGRAFRHINEDIRYHDQEWDYDTSAYGNTSSYNLYHTLNLAFSISAEVEREK